VRNRPILQMIVIGVIATAIAIPLALIIPWFPSKGSIQAGNVRTLYDVLLIATVPIFVLVETVVLFSVWKFRMRPGQEEMDGPPIHGNTRLEVVWTAVPAILIISLCTYAYTVLRSDENSKKGEMTVNVTTRQFAFEFSYPVSPGKQVVSPVLYLAKDQPVVFKLRSLDVIHSFFVPNFSEKLDAVPGIVTTLRVTPNVLGTYPVECTELCGAGHSLMRTSAVVVTPAVFTKWLKSQPVNGTPPIGTPPATVTQAVPDYNAVPGAGSSSSSAPSSGSSSSSSSSTTSGASSSGGSAAAGKAVFTGVGGCSACHTLAAASATGTIGPDLDTRLKSDCALAASQKVRGTTLQQCIETAITKPYAYLPSGYSAGIMPQNFAQRLTQAQIQDLVSFLSSAAK
jgi:cytochrome c oxidase subunit II